LNCKRRCLSIGSFCVFIVVPLYHSAHIDGGANFATRWTDGLTVLS